MRISAPSYGLDRSSASMPCRDGLFVVGHGTRDARGVGEFQELVDHIAGRRPEAAVEPCFLELAQPSIQEAIDRAVAGGARRLTVVPLLLFAAGHAKRDIPRVIAEARARHPSVQIRQSRHLGSHDLVLTLSERRFDEALAGLPQTANEDTLLLLVGRGSRDAEATRAMADFARRRQQRRPVGRTEICFMAMARPSLDTALRAIAGSPFPRVVVQPHLLFRGELLDRLHGAVAATAATQSQRQWVVTAALGPDRDLATAVAEITRQTVTESSEQLPSLATPASQPEP